MGRAKGSNGARLDQHDNDIAELRQDFNKQQEQINQQQEQLDAGRERSVVRDLQETKLSGRYMYSYVEVAELNHVTMAYVQKVVAKYGLYRKASSIG